MLAILTATTAFAQTADSCGKCVTDFDAAGGCAAMRSHANVDSLIPAGCDHCGDEAAVHCGVEYFEGRPPLSSDSANIRYERKYCSAEGVPMYETCEGCGAARGACSGDCTNDDGGHANCMDISWAEGGVSTKAECHNMTHVSLHFDKVGCTGKLIKELEEQADCYMIDQDSGSYVDVCPA